MMQAELTKPIQTKPKPKTYMYFLTILCSFAVLALHMNNSSWNFSATEDYWWRALIAETVFYFAVPVFFMISGANLMDYRERYDTKTFFRKRLLKIILPLFVWEMVFYGYFIGVGRMNPPKNAEDVLIAMVSAISNYAPETIFWFMVSIINVYFCIPVLSLLKDNRKILTYYCVVGFLSYCFFPIFFRILGIPLSSGWTFYLSGSVYVVYAVLGYCLDRWPLPSHTVRLMFALGVFCILLRYFYTYDYSLANNKLMTNLYGYSQFIVLFPSIGVFTLFRSLDYSWIESHPKAMWVLKTFSGCAFGVYLMHRVFIYLLMDVFHMDYTTFVFRWGYLFADYFLCVFLTFIIKKIPILKHIVP